MSRSICKGVDKAAMAEVEAAPSLDLRGWGSVPETHKRQFDDLVFLKVSFYKEFLYHYLPICLFF